MGNYEDEEPTTFTVIRNVSRVQFIEYPNAEHEHKTSYYL